MHWQVLLEGPVPSGVAKEKCFHFAVPKSGMFAKTNAVSYKRSQEKDHQFHFPPHK
jgi:hypothetical protein